MSRSTAPKKIPRFRSRAEEIRFWETHSWADYWDQLEPVDTVSIGLPSNRRQNRNKPKKQPVSLRLEPWQVQEAKKLARRKRVPLQQVLLQWIADGARRAIG